MRQIILDTETTGLEATRGHRIIEIGCVELVKRRLTGNHYHQYLQPDREIDSGAIDVHGISNEFLEDKPRFADVAKEFLEFIDGAELVIHNAPFDVGFINSELKRMAHDWRGLDGHCTVTDTLVLARKMHPGQRNSLDALCKRYDIDNAQRTLHGALLDAEILADVYLAMTGGQSSLLLGAEHDLAESSRSADVKKIDVNRESLRIIRASKEEQLAHQQRLDALDKESDGQCLWRKLDA